MGIFQKSGSIDGKHFLYMSFKTLLKAYKVGLYNDKIDGKRSKYTRGLLFKLPLTFLLNYPIKLRNKWRLH